MCLKTSKTLLIDAPAINTAKLSRTLPAGYLPPRAIGCDFHSNDSSPQLVQCCFTITMVPRCFMVTLGSLFLQVKQNSENNANSFEKNTMNFGSSSAGNPGSTLKLLLQTMSYFHSFYVLYWLLLSNSGNCEHLKCFRNDITEMLHKKASLECENSTQELNISLWNLKFSQVP